MTTIRTELPIATEPWERAKRLFLEQLSPKERTLFEKADLDSIYHDASVSHRQHQQSSKLQAARRRLSPLVDAIDGYGKGLDVMSNTPVAAAFLCPIWGAVRVSLYVAQETEKYFEKLAEMLEKIGRALPLFRDYQYLFPSHERLLQVLSEAYLNVLRFCTDVTALFKEAKTRAVSVVSLTISCKTLWKPFTLRFAEYLKNFNNLKQEVQDEANVAHMIESKREWELQERNRALAETRLQEEKLRQTLQNLSPIDYHQRHRSLRSECHQGTTQWIFDHDSYKSWKRSTERSSIHCSGIPGSGKTILASSVVENLITDPIDPSHLVCFYYCDYADQQTLNPTAILGTFIRQILERSLNADELRECVLNQWANHHSKPLAQELFPAVLNAFGRFECVTIVIDALDELSLQDQHEMGSIISACWSLRTCQVKVFLSCRFEAIILKKVPEPSFSIALSPKLLLKDIYHFVEDIVQDRVDRKDLIIRDPALQQEIIDRLKEGAQDMFLWVKFQVSELCEASNENELRQTLKTLPKDLAGTYQRILHKMAFSKHGKSVKRAFRWIVCAKRPLTIEELNEAVVLEEDDTSFPTERIPIDDGARLRLACGNLVVFDQNLGLVRLAHHTVQQFLTDSQKDDRFAHDDLVNSFRFTLDEAELQVYMLCLTYLCFSDFETQISRRDSNRPGISDSGGFLHSLISYMLPDAGAVGWLTTRILNGQPNSTNNLNTWRLSVQGNAHHVDRERELKQKYSLLGYISSFWCFHFPRIPEEVVRCVHDFIKLRKTLEVKTKALVLEKKFFFPHLPWDKENHGDGSQKTSMLRWLSRTGNVYLWQILTQPQVGNIVYCEPFADAMVHENEEVDLLADVLRGGDELMLKVYLEAVSGRTIGRVIPAWIICQALRLSPRSRHAALFTELSRDKFAIARGPPETRSFWRRGPTSAFWFDKKWPAINTSGFDADAGTFLLNEAVKQDDIDLVQCILENNVGKVVYFEPVGQQTFDEPTYSSANGSPLARAAYGNNIAMVEVLFSYINGTAPLVGATIANFDLDDLYQALRERNLVSMIELIRTLSRSGLKFVKDESRL